MLSAYDDDSQPNDSTRGAWGRPRFRCSGGIKDCDGKMNSRTRGGEAALLVPDEFSSWAQIIERGTRNDAFAGARVASVGGVVFGVRWLDAAFDFASALAFQTVAAAGTERKEPNQSGVEPPHSKEAYRPMGHGKANPGNSGRFGCPQKEFGRNACQWQDVRDTMREAETATNRTLEEPHDR